MRKGLLIGGLVVLAVVGLRLWNDHKREQEEYRERTERIFKAEVDAYWTTVRGTWQTPANLPEQCTIHGKVLPFYVDGDYGSLQDWVYPHLDDAIKATTISDVGTLVLVAGDSRMYSGGATFGITIAADVTIVDVATKTAICKKHFAGDTPPSQMTLDDINAYDDKFWPPIQAYINGLPRR